MSSMYPTPPAIELFLRRTGRGLSRSRARSGAIARALQPFAGRAQGYYDAAQRAEQGVGQAVSQGMSSLGQQLGGDISTALQGIQAPGAAVATHGGGTQQMGAAAGQAIGGLSSAEIGRLHGYGTAEAIYASALPRLAELTGEQERRYLLGQAAEELADLSLRQAEADAENMWRQREWNRQTQLDKIEQQRYRRGFRQDQREFRYERTQDALERKRQERLDALAAAAAEREYGLDVAGYQLDERAQSERERAARVREQQAAAREKRLAGGGGTKKERAEAFYETRADAFKRARELAEPTEDEYGDLTKPSKKEVKQRLWAEFGVLLVGRGYSRAAANAMIERALKAAGY